MTKWIEIAKKAYCSEGDQWDCRDCEMIDYFKMHNCDPAICRMELIRRMIKEGGDANNEDYN